VRHAASPTIQSFTRQCVACSCHKSDHGTRGSRGGKCVKTLPPGATQALPLQAQAAQLYAQSWWQHVLVACKERLGQEHCTLGDPEACNKLAANNAQTWRRLWESTVSCAIVERAAAVHACVQWCLGCGTVQGAPAGLERTLVMGKWEQLCPSVMASSGIAMRTRTRAAL
jgi:hypothetical protein